MIINAVSVVFLYRCPGQRVLSGQINLSRGGLYPEQIPGITGFRL